MSGKKNKIGGKLAKEIEQCPIDELNNSWLNIASRGQKHNSYMQIKLIRIQTSAVFQNNVFISEFLNYL